MKVRSILFALLLAALIPQYLACNDSSEADSDEVAVVETNYGRIVIEFFGRQAPKHVRNFKELARQGFYDGTRFHRLVKEKNNPIAIQGGDPNTINGEPSTWGRGQPNQKTVPAEFSSELKHERGILSAARRPDDINSATSQFFICVTSAPHWDGSYTIYGKVIQGMNVVDTIARAPMWPNTDRPMDPVVVSKVSITGRRDVQ